VSPRFKPTTNLSPKGATADDGVAVTENFGNYQNTPGIGLTLTLGWISRR
jgi:hypothetical protein